MPSRKDLPSKLAKARHELEKAQARVADFEAQLFENQPISSTLLNHEDRYRRLLDSLLEGAELIGFDWRYLYVNDAVAGHGRQSKEVLLHSTVLELYPGIENTEMFAILRKGMEERTTQHFETEFTFPDGTSAWFELSVQPVPEGIFILSLEITERKLTEEILRRSEMHFRSLVETAVDYAIYLLDTDGHVVSWNIGAERLKGYRREEIIGEHFSRFFTPEDQQSARPQQLLQTAEVEGRAEDEGWRVRKDGSQGWEYGVITALRNTDGSLYGFAKISRDLTHRKRAEENIRKLHRTLGVLSDINQAIVRIRHLPSLFEKACEIAVEKGAFRMAWIGLLDPETRSVNPVAHDGISDNALEKLVLTSNTHPIIDALRAGERLICNDIQNDPMWLLWREDASRLGCGSTVALPLIVAGEIRGTFNLHAGEPEFFNEQEMRLMDEMAIDISFAIEVAEQDEQRRQAESAIKRYAQRMEILHHIDRGIINASSIREVVQTALKHIRQIIPCERASVGLFDYDHHEWYLFVVDSNHDTVGEGSRFPIEPGSLENFSQKQIEIVDDLRSLPNPLPAYRQFIEDGLVSALHAHLFLEQRPLGALNLFASTPGFFTAEHQEIATEIANQLAIAIRQVQLSEELARHVKTVEETGKFLQTTLDAFPANTTVIDPDGKIITVNLPWKHFADENGADTTTHYLGMNYLSVCDRAIGNGSEEAAAAAAGIRAVIVGQQAEFFLEYSCNSPFAERWFMLRVTPFAESVPRRVVVAHVNITERKRAEVALQESYHTLEQRVNERTAELQAAKERVEVILNNSTDGILLIDTDLKIQQTNASFNSLFGCEWDDYFDKSLVTLIFAEDADKVTKLIQTVVAEPHRKRIEIRALRKDGKVFDAELSIGLIKDNGLVISIYDITERKAQERQLRYHASIQESVSDAVIATDMDFRIQSWNRTAEAIYGWSAAEAIGKPVDEIVQTTYESEADQARLLQDFLERGAWQGEVIQRHRDGSPINILASVNLFKDDLGQPFGVVSVNRDITERKRADIALSESENRFRHAIINAPFPIMIHADDGEVLHISRAWTEISGYTHNDIPTISDWVDKAYRENGQIVKAVIDKVYSLTEAQRDGEFRIWTKSGEERIWDFVSAPLALMADGRRMSSSMAMDITERKAQERQLRFYASIQESVTDAVVATDMDFRIQSWNRAAEQMYGWHAEEVIGKFSGEILQTQFLSQETREQTMQKLHEQGYVVGEATQRHKDGRTIYVFGSVMLIKDETRLPIGFVAVNHDITKNKRAEEALQQALVKEKELGDLKTRFVSMASHEFRNPLATILATTDTLSAYRNKLTEEQIEQRFDKIKDQVGHLKDIMEDVLMLARMQARRVEFSPVKLDLDALVRSVLDEFESRTDIRHKLEYTVGEGSHELVLDRKLIRQIINNLVSNAIKYSPEGKVIRINLECTPSEVILKISDEGIGIPEADLPHLFEPFHRATNVGTISGTGLGLVITREAVELHSGTIAVESQQGFGTTFIIRIPISIGG